MMQMHGVFKRTTKSMRITVAHEQHLALLAKDAHFDTIRELKILAPN
jgi:hypothetical protein